MSFCATSRPRNACEERLRRRREALHGLIRHAGIYLGANALLWGAGRVFNPGLAWPAWLVWLSLAWGLGLIAHAIWTWRALRPRTNEMTTP
jgi:hypothetical protein